MTEIPSDFRIGEHAVRNWRPAHSRDHAQEYGSDHRVLGRHDDRVVRLLHIRQSRGNYFANFSPAEIHRRPPQDLATFAVGFCGAAFRRPRVWKNCDKYHWPQESPSSRRLLIMVARLGDRFLPASDTRHIAAPIIWSSSACSRVSRWGEYGGAAIYVASTHRMDGAGSTSFIRPPQRSACSFHSQ